jgi:DNA repair exonuclease SbcCD nuclease subunit
LGFGSLAGPNPGDHPAHWQQAHPLIEVQVFRLLHTADWQLGMTRHFLAGEAQARYTADRLEAVRALLRLAAEQACEAVVVAGDVFETNQVDRRTVAQALDAMRSSAVPIYLLPGNHDPHDAGSVYRSRAFREGQSAHLHVLDSSEPRQLPSGAEIVGVPWTSKRPVRDLVAEVLATLAPQARPRVLVAHGAVDALSPDRDNPALISLRSVEQALDAGLVHYVALGDRHSLTDVGRTPRIRYSGTQEPTDFDETAPGHVLVVDVDSDSCTATPHRVARWTFQRADFELVSDEDLGLVERRLAAVEDKARTVVKLGLRGTLTLAQRARLDEIIGRAGDLVAAIVESESRSDIAMRPDDHALADLGLDGFALRAAERLRSRALGEDADARAARGALDLLFRLAGRSS